MAATTGLKCLPNFEIPAPNQLANMKILAATIMSTTDPAAAKTRIAAKYCSERAAKKTVLSRRPMRTIRPR